ncbi:phosphorylase [Flavobacteriales bacterium 34_180_T64]|nr:phosphorylase [Flavobacteriales bacterium 34_180_T64]
MRIKDSELILNPDGSVYHLHLKPEHISNDIIFVGDQDRVEEITQHFDTIEFSIQKREFKTQTGTYNGKRITVISTGIGPDNIDIVLNELDALVNIDLESRQPKEELSQLNIVRIGTSGSLHSDIPVDSILMSTHAIDLNGMLHFYQIEHICHPEMEEAFIEHTNWHTHKSRPVIIKNNKTLEKRFDSDAIFKGVTATAGGFYGPQGRVLRLPLKDSNMNSKIDSFIHKDLRITNLEMETSVIYGLSKLLGHKALSLNAIIANRADGTFSKTPKDVIQLLIKYALDRI